MKNLGKLILVSFLAVIFLSVNAYPDKDLELSETYDNIDRIKIKTVAGDCIISKGEGKTVTLEVVNSYRPRDSFEPRARVSGNTLRLTESIHGSNSGSSTWTLTVPDGIEIEFSTASGNMSVTGLDGYFGASTASGDVDFENCSGEWDISTASGEITVDNCQGEFSLSSASGDIMVDNCRGEFNVSTASGSVEAEGVVLNDESSFSTASGEVDVALGKSAEYDINVGSASGSAVLDFGGHPIQGLIEMESKIRSGRIDCPFDFDDEETFRRGGDKYIRKTVTKGSDTPSIRIGTSSGRAVLREG